MHAKLDFQSINRRASDQMRATLSHFLPGGVVRGEEYIVRNPTRADRRPGSFKINMRTGHWADFATGDRGGDVISLTAGLIIFRIIQGAAGGGLQPTQQAIILDYFPPEKRGTVFAITGITMIAAPILGPTLGGIITDNFSWRWIFYINVPVGLIAAFQVWKMLMIRRMQWRKASRKLIIGDWGSYRWGWGPCS